MCTSTSMSMALKAAILFLALDNGSTYTATTTNLKMNIVQSKFATKNNMVRFTHLLERQRRIGVEAATMATRSPTQLSASTSTMRYDDGKSQEESKVLKADQPFNPGPGITFGSSGLKLNIFGMIYGSIAILLGATYWYSVTALMQGFYFISSTKIVSTIFPFLAKIDAARKIPVLIAHSWGMFLMAITGCSPIVSGRENVKEITDWNRSCKA